MSNHIDFYFDIISPYAYIAHKKILKYKNIVFNYKPIYLGGLHKLAGIDSPAFNKYKLKNNINDCNLVSEKNNIDELATASKELLGKKLITPQTGPIK